MLLTIVIIIIILAITGGVSYYIYKKGLLQGIPDIIPTSLTTSAISPEITAPTTAPLGTASPETISPKTTFPDTTLPNLTISGTTNPVITEMPYTDAPLQQDVNEPEINQPTPSTEPPTTTPNPYPPVKTCQSNSSPTGDNPFDPDIDYIFYYHVQVPGAGYESRKYLAHRHHGTFMLQWKDSRYLRDDYDYQSDPEEAKIRIVPGLCNPENRRNYVSLYIPNLDRYWFNDNGFFMAGKYNENSRVNNKRKATFKIYKCDDDKYRFDALYPEDLSMGYLTNAESNPLRGGSYLAGSKKCFGIMPFSEYRDKFLL